MGKKRKTSDRPQSEAEPLEPATASTKKATIFIRLPDSKAKLKEIFAELADLNNRDLTGEVVQAMEEYAARFRRWPERLPGDETA